MIRARVSERGSSDTVTVVIMGIVVCSVVIFGIARCSTNVSGMSHGEAVKSAHAYAKELSIAVQGIQCAGIDSDGDGYVSCSIMTKSEKLLAVECAGALTINQGCRIPKLNAATGGTP